MSWLPFSGSSPIESRRTSGCGTSRISSAKTEPMCANWSEVLRPRVGVRARVDEDRRPEAGGDDDGDRRPQHAREPADVQQPGGEHRAGVPRGDDGVGLAVADGAARGDEARVGLRPHGVGRLLVHRDLLGRLDELETLGVEAGAARRGRPRCRRATPRPRPRSRRPGRGRRPGRRPLSRATTERESSAARRHGPCTSCSSGRRDAAASAGGRPGTRSRAAPRGDASPGACRGVTSTFSSSGLPSAAPV